MVAHSQHHPRPHSKQSTLPRTKAQAALRRVSFLSFLLSLLKLVAFALTGSLIILASAFDSLSDSAVSLVNSWVERLARSRPDRDHPFGHGGFEVLSSLAQALIIAGMSIYLGWRSISAWTAPMNESEDLWHKVFAFCTIILAIGAGWYFQRYLKLANSSGLERGSLSLLSDLSHYKGDAVFNAAAAIGLGIYWATGWSRVDAACGIIGALLMGKTSIGIFRHSIGDIVHSPVSNEIRARVITIAKQTDSRIVSIHRLRIRQLGPNLFMDFHMTLPHDLTLNIAHEIGESVTRVLRREFAMADVLIHLDPDSEPDDELWDDIQKPH